MTGFLIRLLLLGWGLVRGTRAIWAAAHRRRGEAFAHLAVTTAAVSMAAFA